MKKSVTSYSRQNQVRVSNNNVEFSNLKKESFLIVIEDTRYYPFAMSVQLERDLQVYTIYLTPKVEKYGIAILMNYRDDRKNYALKLYAKNNRDQECEVSPQNKFCANARYDGYMIFQDVYQAIRIERKYLVQMQYKTTVEYSKPKPPRLLKIRSPKST